MIKGITEQESSIIKNILKPFANDFEFYYYGSRVKGNFSKLSDLDILIKSQKAINSEQLSTIKTAFDNSLLPYIVNFTDYNNIENNFFKLIEKDLVNVFSTSN